MADRKANPEKWAKFDAIGMVSTLFLPAEELQIFSRRRQEYKLPNMPLLELLQVISQQDISQLTLLVRKLCQQVRVADASFAEE